MTGLLKLQVLHGLSNPDTLGNHLITDHGLSGDKIFSWLAGNIVDHVVSPGEVLSFQPTTDAADSNIIRGIDDDLARYRGKSISEDWHGRSCDVLQSASVVWAVGVAVLSCWGIRLCEDGRGVRHRRTQEHDTRAKARAVDLNAVLCGPVTVLPYSPALG